MCLSVRSPLNSEVLSLLESLSPPPTPVAKRGAHFIPSNAATPVPKYFPASQSIFGALLRVDYPGEKEVAEEMQLRQLASRPVPSFRLKRRPTPMNSSRAAATTEGAKKMRVQVHAEQLPPLPLAAGPALASKSSAKMLIPLLPSLSTLSVESSKSTSESASESGPGQQGSKLPSFERQGMHRRVAQRRNSFVARSA